MEDGHNGAVVAQPPSSDTGGVFVNYQATAPAPVSAPAAPTPPPPSTTGAAAAFGTPAQPRRAAPPCGAHLNNNNNNPVIKGGQLKGPGNADHRTRRPRRGKRKSKNMPYYKDRMYRRKAVAPNNTNQFLMDDHNDGPDFDLKLLEASARYNENGRTRNSSHTSIESEGDPMYSSSDEDAASMQKEFCDTYRLVQEEELAALTKPDLIQRVLDLEEKVQVLESTSYRRNIMMYLNGTSKEDDEVSIDPETFYPDDFKLMIMQMKEMTSKNKALTAELEATKKELQTMTKLKNESDSESSSDSSDSSSSSSDGQEIEMSFLVRSSGRDDHKPNDD